MKKLYCPSLPPMPERKERRRDSGRTIIGMPAIKCHHCRSTKFQDSHVRPNKLCSVQVCRCLNKKCGRRFTPKDMFGGKTCREDYVEHCRCRQVVFSAL